MAKVTGIGGVFFKSTKDNKALVAWYQKNLGLKLEDFGGAVFMWRRTKQKTMVLRSGALAKKIRSGFLQANQVL
jgi:hypothetical protein